MSQLGSLFALTREEVEALMALPEEDRVEHMYEKIMETLYGTLSDARDNVVLASLKKHSLFGFKCHIRNNIKPFEDKPCQTYAKANGGVKQQTLAHGCTNVHQNITYH